MPINEQTIKIIDDYIENERPKSDSDFLFLSLRGNHLTDRYIRDIVYLHKKNN